MGAKSTATKKNKVPIKFQPDGSMKSFIAIIKLVKSNGKAVHLDNFGMRQRKSVQNRMNSKGC